jgi:hypothetical protein
VKSGDLREGSKLKMHWSSRDHVAFVTFDGHIEVDGKSYASPSSAGKAVAQGNNVDGWAWWFYEASPGVWHRLTNLRHKKLKWARNRPKVAS